MQVNIELKESREGVVIKVAARLSYKRGGKVWHATAAGQGASRADAVADLASKKLPVLLKSMLLKRLDEVDAKTPSAGPPVDVPSSGVASPKGQELPVQSGIDSQDLRPKPDSQAKSSKPNLSGQVSSQPVTQSPTSESANDQQKKPIETLPKPDGTLPAQESGDKDQPAF